VWKPQRSSVELVTVFFGANDAALASLNPQQHVPLATFSQNLREIVSRVQSEWHAKRVLVVGPPPIHREKYLAWRRQRPANVSKPDEELLDRTLEQALQYSSAARAVAASCAGRVGFVDLIQAFAAAPQPLEMLLSDGLHLTGLGNALVFGAVHAALAQHFPELVVTAAEDGGFGAQGSCCDALRPHGAWFQDLPRVQEAARLKRTKI
jgi:lysophospholipase L1-like esterase